MLLQTLGKQVFGDLLVFFLLQLFLLLLHLFLGEFVVAAAQLIVRVLHFFGRNPQKYPYTYTPQVVWHSKQPIMESTRPPPRQISQNLLLLPQFGAINHKNLCDCTEP